MKKISLILLSSLVFVSCSVTMNLGGKTYKYRSKKRTLQLVFVNDSICKFKNTFHCEDIDQSIKELVAVCKYERVNDRIYLQNIDCKNDSCEYDLTVDIPVQNSSDCDFLNAEHRNRKSTIGPNYSTDYRKYGSVPMIDIDTLYIQKNRIVLIKKNEKESVGFVFK